MIVIITEILIGRIASVLICGIIVSILFQNYNAAL